MLRETRCLVAVLSLLFLFAASGSASAVTYYGCFYCRPVALTGMGATCRQVGDGANGEGWQCTELYDLPWPDGPECYTNNDPCHNVNVNGGGGGGIGSGSGQACQTTGFCPAECYSCSGGNGRPAV